MIKAIKTLLLVLLLTAMIWAWAEESQTRPLEKQAIELEVDVPNGTGFAVFDPISGQWGHKLKLHVAVDFHGQQGGISRLSQKITRGEYRPVHSLRIDDRLRADDGDGVHSVELNLVRILNEHPELDRMHTVVTAATPGTYTLMIGRLKQYNLPIEVKSADKTRLALTDVQASVMLPAPLYAELVQDNRARLQADLLPGAQPDGQQTAVLAQQIGGYPIRPTPARTIVRRDMTVQEFRLENVQVQPVFSRDFPFQEYELVSDRHYWRKTVVVTGPAGRTLTANDIDLQVRFEISDARQSEVAVPRDVEVKLPAGFLLVRIEPEASIQFRFVERLKP